jgi:rhodanese-related sulfurtransferase
MRSSLTALALTLVLAAVSAASSFAQAAPRIPLDELRKLHASGAALVVDVRDAQSFANGHIPGAINIPLGTEQQPEHRGKLKAAGKRPIVTYCA